MQTARCGRGAGPRQLTWVALTVVLLRGAAAHSIAPAQPPSPTLAERPLVPGAPVRFNVDSQHSPTFSLTLQRGDFVEVRVEQLSNLAQVLLREPGREAHAIRFRDSGRGAVIDICVVADSAGRYELTVEPYQRDAGATGWVTASAIRTATAADRVRVAAEELQAHAEWSRRKGAASTWTAALADYEAAAADARKLRDVTLLRAALTGESRLQMYRLNDYDAALELAGKAAQLPQDDQDLPGQALAWKTLATAEHFVAQYTRSIRDARHALALYRRTDDLYWQGILLGNLAYTYRELGESGLALRSAEASLAIARSIGDWFGVDFDLEALAEFHLARGELDRSFELYQQALDAIRAHPYPQEEAAVWNGLGELYEIADAPDEAQDAFVKALRIATDAHDSAGALKVLANLGETELERSDPRSAVRYYEEGLERATALRLPREESFLLTGLASALAASGKDQAALADYRRAIALATQISQADSEAAAWQGLGDWDAGAGRAAEAQAAYTRSYALWSRQSDRLHEATALASLARLDFAGGALEQARSRIERALALIETSRATLTSRNLRTSYFASQHAYFDLGVAILMALDRRSPGSGYDVRALQLAERGRARTLLDALRRADQLPEDMVRGDLAAALRRNREQVDAAYARWRELLEDAAARPPQFDALRMQIDVLLRSGDQLEARARAVSPRYAALSAERPVSIEQLRRSVLSRDAALLCFWLGADRSYAWLLRRDSVSTFTLPGASALAREAQDLRRAITARIQQVAGENLARRIERIRDADRRAAELGGALGAQILPSPAFSQLRTLYVVPDGPLFGVPFAALRPRASARTLVQTTAVLEEPSASVLLFLASEPQHSSGGRAIAVFADPVYTRTDPRFDHLSARVAAPAPAGTDSLRWAPGASASQLPRLLGSREEALDIAAVSGAARTTLRMGFDATARAVRQTHWASYGIAHFAVHALLEPAHPEFSGLALTMFRSDGTPQDGVLRLRDIDALDMPVDLVVLSGCRTLEGRDVPGEGLVGLYRAFLMSGAHAVLGSLWSIEDRATGRLMSELYANLFGHGLSTAEALRSAQLAFADSKDFSAPYYWAGFSIEGAGTTVP